MAKPASAISVQKATLLPAGLCPVGLFKGLCRVLKVTMNGNALKQVSDRGLYRMVSGGQASGKSCDRRESIHEVRPGLLQMITRMSKLVFISRVVIHRRRLSHRL